MTLEDRVVEATNHGDPVYVVTYTAQGKRRTFEALDQGGGGE